MVRIRNYGVGTGYTSSGVTGKKSTFAHDERVYACHVWDNLAGNEEFIIYFDRKIGADWNTEVTKSWRNQGYSSAFQWSYIKNYSPGSWRARFSIVGQPQYTSNFTIKEEPAPPEPPPPEYPRDVSRGPYSITARNPGEETHLKDFLGIDPPGDDMDTWLSKRDLAGLNQWKDYWISIFGPLGRSDLLTFISNKYEEYKAKLEVPPEPPDERPWYIRVLDKITEFLEEDFTVRPLEVLKLGDELFNKIAPEEWTVKKVDIPSWIDELLLTIFFMPPVIFQTTGEIEAGLTATQSNKILTLMKNNRFTKALDIMKANPTKYAKDFAALPPKTAAEILKGMRKDHLAGLATSVFKASWDDALIKTAPLWRRVMFAVGKHKWKGFFGLISLGGLIMGTDLWGNWSIVDNLQFMSGREADDILKEVEAGRMTKEDALKELNQMLEIVKAGEIKVKTSAGWNVMQILFAPLWDDLARLSVDKLESAIAKLEVIEPAEPIGILTIRPTPSDAKVSVEGQIPTTGVFSKEIPVGSYEWVVSKYLTHESKSGTIELTEAGADFTVELEEKPEEPTEEEDWDKIREEQEAYEEEQRRKAEDYWRKIREEQEAQREADRLESEKYWANIYAEIEEKKLAAKEEDKAYWDRIREEQEAYKIRQEESDKSYWEAIYGEREKAESERRTADEEYWAAIETARVEAEAERKIAAEDYWEQIYADQKLRDEQKRAEDEAYWDAIRAAQEARKQEKTYVPTVYSPAPILTEPSYASIYPTLDPPQYSKLYPEVKPYVPYEPLAPELEKEVLINIETTDAKPWKGNIFSIAWLDLSMPGSEPQVIVDGDEQGILKAFIDIFEAEGFKKIWGFKTIFDYRFIFNKLMLYRMQSKAFFDAELGDVKQLMDQVKEAFVYFPDKTGKLDDYGKELLGIGKYGTQEALLRRYIAGDIAYVERFQMQQIQVTKGLYDLFRFSSSGGLITPIPTLPETSSPVLSPSPSQNPISTQLKKCPNCLAEQPIGAKECDICKTKL